MRLYKIFFLIILLAAISGSCKKFSDLQQNPNASIIGTPKLLLTGLELDMFDGPWNYTQRSNQFYILAFDYYGDQDYASEWTSGPFYYSDILNANRLDVEANKLGSGANAYHALAKFMRVFYFLYMTEQMGDIPFSDAVEGDKSVYFPKYDPQKQIYQQSLQWLEEANDSLGLILSKNPNASVDGDIFYNGSLANWQKAINSYRLRELIMLSKKESDPDLNIKGQFQQILSDPNKYPIMSSNSDNLQINYNNSDKSNYNPLYPDEGQIFGKRNVLAATWVNLLDSLRDPRIFVIASPAPALPNDPSNLFARYKGANTGDKQDYIFSQTNAGQYSSINYNFWLGNGAIGIPTIQLGASETDFNIAEAINRGWITGDAAMYYNQGIILSMQFYGVSTTDINTYLAQPLVQYAGDNPQGLKQILTEKYIGFFNNSGWQAYYNYRRTGIPTFSVGPSNLNSGKIPLRFTYPQSEYQNNLINVQAAIQSQFGGSDTRNDIMWLLQ